MLEGTRVVLATLCVACACWLASACSSSDSPSGGGPSGGGAVGNLTTECMGYCQKQTAAGCPNSLPANSCQQSCEGIGKMFPSCEASWNALNHCMANTTLTCDAQGNPAVGQECFDKVEAYGNCLNGDAGP